METIINGTTPFNTACVKYGPPKLLSSGGKMVNIKNSGSGNALRFSTPLMLTWGASDFEGNKKFDLSLQFPNSDNQTEQTNTFLNNMREFETKLKADAMTNSKEWFGKVHKDAAIIDVLFTPMLKYPKNKDTGEADMTRDPTLRVKFNQIKNVYQCNVYNEDSKPLWLRDEAEKYEESNTPMSYFRKGMKVATVIECGGLWFANGKFGVTWRLMQAVTQSPADSVFTQCLIQVNAEDKKAIVEATADAPDNDGDCGIVSPTQQPVVDTAVESSDEEEEDEEEEEEEEEEETPEPEPEPVKPVKKKVVRTKKA